MGRIPEGSYAWHDDVDSLQEQHPTDPVMAGLPEHWRDYERRIAAALFTTLWLIGTLPSSPPFQGPMKGIPVAGAAWALLAVARAWIGLVQVRIRQRRRVGFVCCFLGAAMVLLGPMP